MISANFSRRFYPPGYRDGTHAFYTMVRSELTPSSVVLNLGAGPATNSPTRILRGEVSKVIGADVDPVVLENNEVDEAVLIGADNILPFEKGTFDVVVSDFVLEHVEQPDTFFREVKRVLRSGGHFYFRTPNRWHYVALISSLTPYWFHQKVANRARGLSAQDQQPWPTYYRANSSWKLRRLAQAAGFQQVTLELWESEPAYLRFHEIPYVLGVAYERLVNRAELLRGLRAAIFGVCRG